MFDFSQYKLPKIDFTPVEGIPCICASFSGGPDSLVLLFTLVKLFQEKAGTPEEFSLHVVHFEHGIRGQASLDDAEFCQKVARELDLPFHLISLNVPNRRRRGEGIEEAARRCRQEWWEHACRRTLGMEFAVAVGHHADDRIETSFLRFMRGANASGLSGLQTMRHIRSVVYWRPLLQWTRDSIEEFAKTLPYKYRTDLTNLGTDYARNKLRNIVLPCFYEQFPGAKEAILTALEVLSLDADTLDTQAAELFKEKASASGNSIDYMALKESRPAIRYRLVRQLFANISDGQIMPDKTFMDRLDAFLKKTENNSPRTLSSSVGTWAIIDNYFRIQPNTEELTPDDTIWDYQTNPLVVFGSMVLRFRLATMAELSSAPPTSNAVGYFDADLLPQTLKITVKKNGDRINLYGTADMRPLKKLFSDAHISSIKQKSYPVIRNPETDEIIWIANLRRSNIGILTPFTRSVAHFISERIVDVAAAVIMRSDGCVLLASRPAGKEHAFCWEFPGGKIESDETPEQCIVREIREELDMNLVIHRRIFQSAFDYGTKYVRLSFFSAVSDDDPDAMENQSFKWLAPQDLDKLPLLPADVPVAKYLKTIDIAAQAEAINMLRTSRL